MTGKIKKKIRPLRKLTKRLLLYLFTLSQKRRPKRFELLTPWFEAKYSIQLSYGRINSRNIKN